MLLTSSENLDVKIDLNIVIMTMGLSLDVNSYLEKKINTHINVNTDGL